jgi:hypothetical protein
MNVVGAIAIVLGSFFITLKILNYWDMQAQQVQLEKSPIQEPAYDIVGLPHLKLGQQLDFSNGQNRRALLSGWSDSEPPGVWSEGHSAFVGFIVDGGVWDAIAHIEVYLVLGKMNAQRVQVWSGTKKLFEYTLRSMRADLKIPLSALTIKDGAPLILGFYLPNASSPHDLMHTSDTRVVAIRLESLELVHHEWW